jgi:hypothetical protein
VEGLERKFQDGYLLYRINDSCQSSRTESWQYGGNKCSFCQEARQHSWRRALQHNDEMGRWGPSTRLEAYWSVR